MITTNRHAPRRGEGRPPDAHASRPVSAPAARASADGRAAGRAFPKLIRQGRRPPHNGGPTRTRWSGTRPTDAIPWTRAQPSIFGTTRAPCSRGCSAGAGGRAAAQVQAQPHEDGAQGDGREALTDLAQVGIEARFDPDDALHQWKADASMPDFTPTGIPSTSTDPRSNSSWAVPMNSMRRAASAQRDDAGSLRGQ